jgi:hypothetical protein
MSPYNPVAKIDDLAISMGATHKLVYNTYIQTWQMGILERSEPWSDHYFNAEGLEIGYIIRGMIDPNIIKVHVLDEPRHWDELFLNAPCYSRYPLQGG